MAALYLLVITALGLAVGWLLLPFSIGAASGCVVVAVGLAFLAGLFIV